MLLSLGAKHAGPKPQETPPILSEKTEPAKKVHTKQQPKKESMDANVPAFGVINTAKYRPSGKPREFSTFTNIDFRKQNPESLAEAQNLFMGKWEDEPTPAERDAQYKKQTSYDRFLWQKSLAAAERTAAEERAEQIARGLSDGALGPDKVIRKEEKEIKEGSQLTVVRAKKTRKAEQGDNPAAKRKRETPRLIDY
eukprot:TRINITY_DN10007_c0_g1_i1.p1 TRINITY_DN10007_c0_g1~~TRINITY_DN10007_c0_g1_i1.p1  ORF type:complete len:196 (+),score=28.86 TRINITY_DN10007_c0_g1_i1:19-606(+)